MYFAQPSFCVFEWCGNTSFISLAFNLAWEEFPTKAKTLVYPVKEAEFPTVTLCAKNNNPDRWGPVIKIFDHLKRSCSSQR